MRDKELHGGAWKLAGISAHNQWPYTVSAKCELTGRKGQELVASATIGCLRSALREEASRSQSCKATHPNQTAPRPNQRSFPCFYCDSPLVRGRSFPEKVQYGVHSLPALLSILLVMIFLVVNHSLLRSRLTWCNFSQNDPGRRWSAYLFRFGCTFLATRWFSHRLITILIDVLLPSWPTLPLGSSFITTPAFYFDLFGSRFPPRLSVVFIICIVLKRCRPLGRRFSGDTAGFAQCLFLLALSRQLGCLRASMSVPERS